MQFRICCRNFLWTRLRDDGGEVEEALARGYRMGRLEKRILAWWGDNVMGAKIEMERVERVKC